MTVSQRNKVLKLLLLSVSLVMLMPGRAQAYIGPGAGFAAAASLFAMFTAMLSAVVALLTWPVRCLIRAIRGRRTFARSRIKRIVILGLDGMDYSLTQKFLAEGKLPNFARLSQEGCFKPLATTVPPISPVAWSSFQTGVNPGKHNIFDFLTRDKKNYLPRLSSVDIRGARRKISFGKYQLPIGKPDIRLLRKSKPFWSILGRHGVFSSVLRVPVTFPPEKFHGVQLSGMCVPDLRGTQGTFSYYTTRKSGESELTAGESFVVTRSNDTIKADLIGPENPLQRNPSVLKCPFVVTITDDSTVRLAINGDSYVLKKDVYTEWIKVRFKAAPGMKVHGICRFLLLSTTPEFKLYVTPINIDPEKPAMSVSHPAIYSTYLAKSQGPFATLRSACRKTVGPSTKKSSPKIVSFSNLSIRTPSAVRCSSIRLIRSNGACAFAYLTARTVSSIRFGAIMTSRVRLIRTTRHPRSKVYINVWIALSAKSWTKPKIKTLCS
jgi:hypothetical protein